MCVAAVILSHQGSVRVCVRLYLEWLTGCGGQIIVTVWTDLTLVFTSYAITLTSHPPYLQYFLCSSTVKLLLCIVCPNACFMYEYFTQQKKTNTSFLRLCLLQDVEWD